MLLLDDILRSEFEKSTYNKPYSLIDIRLNELNLYILIILFLSNSKNTFFNYVIKYIKTSECKILLTFNDNLTWYYKIKQHLPYLKVISVQNGYRNKYFFKSLEKEKKLKADYIFTFSKSYSKLYKKIIKTKTIENGSFKNNLFKKIKNKKKDNSLLFIASGYEKKYEVSRGYKSELFKPDTVLVKNLYLYCKKNKIHFEIAGKTNEKKEYEFYKKILNNGEFKFHYRNNDRNLYFLSDRKLAIASSHSTFGIESLARGNRTAIFNNKRKLMKGHYDIFWYLKMAINGVFWSSKSDLKEVSRILNFVIYSKEKKWNDRTKKTINKLLFFEYGNPKLKKKLNRFT